MTLSQSHLQLALSLTSRSGQTPPLLLVNLLYISTIDATRMLFSQNDVRFRSGEPLHCNAAIQKWAAEGFNVILQNYLYFKT